VIYKNKNYYFFTDKPSVPSTSGQAKSQKPKARAKAQGNLNPVKQNYNKKQSIV